MTPRLETIRECFDGVIPGIISTCDGEGTPNLALLSQVQFVDNEHVALSYQFFNKTRHNLLGGSPVRLLLNSYLTGAEYLLKLTYLRTETAGPLFEQMKAKLAGIASHEGMSGIFRLLGSDLYRVDAIVQMAGPTLPLPIPPINYLTALRRATERLAGCANLACLLESALEAVTRDFGIGQVMLLVLDEARGCLYTLASRGYPESGVGSEIPVGAGVIGIAARERTPIRIGFMTTEYTYGRTIREQIAEDGQGATLETLIPLPGLPAARSQLAVPICAPDRLLGVLYVESVNDLHFGYDDEDALVAFAGQLGLAMAHHQQSEELPDEADDGEIRSAPLDGPPVAVRYFAANASIFVDDDYLIKGVAGAILWAVLSDYAGRGRTGFTNKGLRVDPRIRLPGVSDNLEARLVLLQRRLAERAAGIQISKVGRGRYSLDIKRPLDLIEG